MNRTVRKKPGEVSLRVFIERLAATYSRRIYKTTTIGPAVFDGRVRNGNGSDHRGIATKVFGARALELPLGGGSDCSDVAQTLKSERTPESFGIL